MDIEKEIEEFTTLSNNIKYKPISIIDIDIDYYNNIKLLYKTLFNIKMKYYCNLVNKQREEYYNNFLKLKYK